MRSRMLLAALCGTLLSAGSLPALASVPAGDDKESVAPGSNSRVFTGTLVENKGGSLTIKRDTGEIEYYSLSDPGLTVRIDKGVTKGSRIKVTETLTSGSREVLVELTSSPSSS